MIHSIRYDETNRQYHQDPDFMSFSGFKKFQDCPAKYPVYLKHQKENQEEGRDLGTLTHMGWCEWERFKKTCVHIGGPMNKNPWKKQADDAKEAGLIPVGDTDYRNIMGMLESLDKDPDIRALRDQGKSEVSVRWTDDDTGVPMKCRFDKILMDSGIAGDLKTFDSVHFAQVQRQIMRMKYHLQTPWYLRGASEVMTRKVTTMVHVFVETEDPWLCIPFALDDASVERGDVEIKDGLIRVAACLESKQWPAPLPGVRPMSLPDYAFKYEGVES